MCRCHVQLRYLLAFALIMTARTICAQTDPFTFEHLSIEEGLSQNTVFAITQDAHGFMWFGTRDGLNRYDSRSIKTYLHQPLRPNSISDNTVYSLLRDSRNRLWVGTAAGLNLYDPVTDGFKYVPLSSDEQSTELSNSVMCIVEDSHKNIWVGTRNGLNLMKENDGGNFSFTHFQDSNSDIHTIFEDDAGTLWVGTASGLLKLTVGVGNTLIFTSYKLPNSISSKMDEINSIAQYGNGMLLVATENSGVMAFDPRNGSFLSLPWLGERNSGPEAARTILNNNGEYWIGTIGGLYIANPSRSEFIGLRNAPDIPLSISDNSVRSLYADRDGSIWIGTFHGGVNFYNKQRAQFQHIEQKDKLHFKVASALASDAHNNLWIATEGSGLFFKDADANVTQHFRHLQDDPNTLSHNNVKCLLGETDGIWAGTIKGLNYYDFKKKKFTRYHHQVGNSNSLPDDAVYDIVKDTDDNLWIATYRGGLCKYDRRSETYKTFRFDSADPTSLSSDGATSLLIDSKENLWVGTISGLNLKLRNQDSFKRFIHDDNDTTSLSGGYILFVYEDSDHRIWVGTRSNGLNLLDVDSGKFRRFSSRDGLPGNTIYAMQEDPKGYLWISTDNGISRLDPTDYRFYNYDRTDGLVCKQFNANSACIDSSGNFYFGGYNGIVVFDPGSITQNTIAPNVRLLGLKLFDREVKIDSENNLLTKDINYYDELTLAYDQNVFSISFAGLNFINSRKNQFAFKLDGFEDRWNYTMEPVATYMNLEPGRYTLLVKASNNDGIWSERPVSIKLHVTPPPWKSWWAYSLYTFALIGLFVLWSRFNRKKLKLEHELEIEHLELKKQEEIHQAKLSFFANIIHEIRTPLTLMIGPVERVLTARNGDQQLKKELSLVRTNTDRLQRLLNQLLDFHKQETGNVQLRIQEENIVEFIDEIRISFKDYASSRNVALEFHSCAQDIRLWFDREELSKVFYNLLVNAFKFTPGGGAISISVDRDGEQVKIIIEDTGLGIPESNLRKIFHRFYQAENSGVNGTGVGIGLALAKGIIDLHHGSIMVESKEATRDNTGYTRFTIVLLSGNRHFDTTQIKLTEINSLTETATETESIISDASQKPSSGNPPLLLLVEDNPDIRAYMKDVLNGHYHVIESADGVAGLEVAVEQLPDIILSDVMMPRMDGLELVNKLKNDPRTSHIPVILLTARGALNYQLEGYEIGADDYLAKPVNTKLLLAKIKNCLLVREKLKEKYSRIVTLKPAEEDVGDPNDRFLQKLMSVLEDNITDATFNVSKLVREIGMSRPVLFRKTKMLTGLSIVDLIRNVRLKKAEMLLKQKKLSISEVAFTVGFTDPKYFSKSFRHFYGKSPSQFLDDVE